MALVTSSDGLTGIFAESETEFFLKVVDAQLSFSLEAAGQAKGLVLHQGGRDIPAKRLE